MGRFWSASFPPVGMLQVTFSTNLYIVFNQVVGVVDKEMRLKAKIAHEVYHKELYCQSVFKKSYAEYLDEVMQTLIHGQDCALKETCSAPELGSVQNHANSYTDTSADVIPNIDAHIYQ